MGWIVKRSLTPLRFKAPTHGLHLLWGFCADSIAIAAHVLDGKYGHHLPLDRQSKIFARQGRSSVPCALQFS